MDEAPKKANAAIDRRRALLNMLDHGRLLGTALSLGGGGYFTAGALGQKHESINLGVPVVELVDPCVGPVMLAVGAAGVAGDCYYHRRDTLKILGRSTVAVVGAGALGYDIARDEVRDLIKERKGQEGGRSKNEPPTPATSQNGSDTRPSWKERSSDRSVTDSRERD